ncbi:hypothetical protein [uncultured Limosilactobacillus sp.]|uniref:hypothetical protein n=1 Tax=uncultured Limosilactobacillus sp. TaxID=2837629 RepID=UPI002591CAAA|nr:hypothetical protein [uncultured Limosilactobacillus sp.]
MIKKLAKAFGLPSLLYLLGVGLYNLSTHQTGLAPISWALGWQVWVGMIILLIGWPLVLYFRQK